LATEASGVGHDPDSISKMWGTNGRRWYAIPFRVVPERGQVAENVSESPDQESWDVLHEDKAGS
jgi:hypothetical protein